MAQKNENLNEVTAPYVASFKSAQALRNGGFPSWLSESREKAMDFFSKNGFPSKKNEQWKYTNVAPIAEGAFRFADESSVSGVSLPGGGIYDPSWPRLVFVHGVYSEKLSSVKDLPRGLKVMRMSEALKTEDDSVRKYLGQYSKMDQNGFSALNQAFFQDGAFIYLEMNAICETPVQIVHLCAKGEGFMGYPRHLLVAGPNSKAVIVESFVSSGTANHFTDVVTEIILEQGAQLDYYKIMKEGENFHIGRTEVNQRRDSTLNAWSLTDGGLLVRYDIHSDLAEEGASARLNGLYLVLGRQHVDNHILVDHLKPHGTSAQLYKGILKDRARAVFNGKAFVHPDAQKADAVQINKNLLLSENAAVDTKPELEICADDVKCSHGAAIGQLDENQVFYLKSRGLGDEQARRLLAYGFASEVVHTIKIDVIREDFDRLLLKELAPEGGGV